MKKKGTTPRKTRRAPAQRQPASYGLLALILGLVLVALLACLFGVAAVSRLVTKTTEAPAATEAPVAEAPAQSQPLVARDLGPWAPNGNNGETFEVTCNELNCEATHVQLWWPAGSNQPWGTKEISVFIPAGLSIEVQLGAGKGFEYPLGYLLANIHAEIAADNARRDTDTSFFGTVDIDDLIKTGLVVVRYDRRGQ